ncbi:enoyl-CoA hydratase-related protein [uncultured Pseudacidovorax sp.]|uniref:enoyl-CoA hydratase/isomerase family protein n=1 Tax=uncultured Pseudacidovorax sp. TaxID=679313 RepID=UPI0025EABFFF|nr:enoyl-CoA hydratase-related protein [uncultured Pseudacidovorax sp.]
MNPKESSVDTESPVLLRRDGAIATLSFNRPAALNALDLDTAKAFSDVCAAVVNDSSVRAIVVRGEGRAFGAGGDLASLRQSPSETAHALIEGMHASIRLLAAANAPVIASLHGMVAGGSFSLALACDLAIAADDTRFNLAYAKVAANCDVSGSWSLPRLVGLRRAMQIALLSETFDADEALKLGLVNRVVPSRDLIAETQALARRLAEGPTLAYGRMKRLLRQSFENGFAQQLDAERDAFVESAGTRDFSEAMDAFFEKRRPTFVGR